MSLLRACHNKARRGRSRCLHKSLRGEQVHRAHVELVRRHRSLVGVVRVCLNGAGAVGCRVLHGRLPQTHRDPEPAKLAAHYKTGDGPDIRIIERRCATRPHHPCAQQGRLTDPGTNADPAGSFVVGVRDEPGGEGERLDLAAEQVAEFVPWCRLEVLARNREPLALAAGAVTAAGERVLDIGPRHGGGGLDSDCRHPSSVRAGLARWKPALPASRAACVPSCLVPRCPGAALTRRRELSTGFACIPANHPLAAADCGYH
jgi:hypothetical protein